MVHGGLLWVERTRGPRCGLMDYGNFKFFDRLLLFRNSRPESNTQWVLLYIINLYFAWIQVRQLYNGKRKALIDSLVLLASLPRDNNIEVQALAIFLNGKLSFAAEKGSIRKFSPKSPVNGRGIFYQSRHFWNRFLSFGINNCWFDTLIHTFRSFKAHHCDS